MKKFTIIGWLANRGRPGDCRGLWGWPALGMLFCAALGALGAQAAQVRWLAQSAARSEPGAWFQAGQVALQNGDLDAAEKDFFKVLEFDPKAGAAYANLGVIAMRRKNWDLARKQLKQAEALSPAVAGIRLNLGLVEFRQGNYRLAIPAFESVVRDEPKATQPRYLLGLCQVFTEQSPAAVATLVPMWETMSTDVMYLYVLDMAADKSGDKALDERVMKRFASVGQETAEFHLILAKAHLQHHEDGQALVELNRVAAMNPSMPFLHFNYGFAYLGMGQFAKSEAEFLLDARIDPELADNYYQLGVLYAETQRPAESQKAFLEALKRDPHRPGAWFGLAKNYSDAGNYPEALKALDEALKVVPESDKVHFVRGQVLQHLGRKEEAAAEFATSKKLLNAKLNKDREDLLEQLLPSPELKVVPN